MTGNELDASPTYRQQAETWLDKAAAVLFDESLPDDEPLWCLEMALTCLNAEAVSAERDEL